MDTSDQIQEEEIGTTPLETTLLWYPFHYTPIEVSLPNYRSIVIHPEQQVTVRKISRDLFFFRYKRWLGLEPRNTHTLYLIRDHGPAGTWSPDDAKKNK